MVSHTLLDTGDDLGDTLGTHVFDVGLANSLLLSSSFVLAGCVISLAAGTRLLGDGLTTSLGAHITLIALAAIASWHVLVAISRRRRRDDQFVIHRFGFARYHGTGVDRFRWAEISAIEQSGSMTGSLLARWTGSDYVCRIDLHDGTTTTFDNYVRNAAALGQQIERRAHR